MQERPARSTPDTGTCLGFVLIQRGRRDGVRLDDGRLEDPKALPTCEIPLLDALSTLAEEQPPLVVGDQLERVVGDIVGISWMIFRSRSQT